MVLNKRSHQKKVERRKAKIKEKHQALKQRTQQSEEKLIQAIPQAPILHCFMSASLFEIGLGPVLISRLLPNERVACSTFLLDIFCLGVKDAVFDIYERAFYDRNFYKRINRDMETEDIEPAYALKLVEGAVEYARNLGFSPHPDYQIAKVIFGDIDARRCGETFTFGKNGKPVFISGPNDSPSRIAAIVHDLTRSCGPDGFRHMIVSEDGSELDDLEDEDD